MTWWQDGTVVTLLAVIISSIGMLYLAHTDPKRRRAHRLASAERTTAQVAMVTALVFSPLIWMLAIEHYGALCMWLAAITVVGWLIAWKRPKHQVRQPSRSHPET